MTKIFCFTKRKLLPALFLGFLHLNALAAPENNILLAKNSKAYVFINMPLHPSETINFAATELSRYLQSISGAVFSIKKRPDNLKPEILIKSDTTMAEEEYHIAVHDSRIFLAGGSGRAVLYAVYDFLQRLGCVWIAPQLAFYHGSSEYIPQKTVLFYKISQTINEHPQFSYRKIDVEEGRSHNVKNLKQLIEWMPKARFNILMIPLDYGGAGRVQWDRWRKELTPELKKRGLVIEVGGHGYQNFLNAKMEDSAVFYQHPDWFGKDKACKPSPAEYRVFNTSDSDAVRYLIHHVLTYIDSHPEINIFDFWPPDGAHWADCPELKKLGLPVDRQAFLVNKVNAAIKKVRPGVRLEMIAYQPVLLPPQNVRLNKNILVDFCPINQSFEKQIYDSSSTTNAAYVKAIHDWRQSSAGDIGLYSYFRKYAWHSLPNIIPHFIQGDMKWYAAVPLQGISSYAEPGDWSTYELNHFILGYLAWNPNVNVDSLINRYGLARYGSLWKKVKPAYITLEHTVALYCSIPYTKIKSKTETAKAETQIATQLRELKKEKPTDTYTGASLSRLLLMLQYADYDLKIQDQVAAHATNETILATMKQLLLFLKTNKGKGVFIISDKDDLSWLMKHYHVKPEQK